MFQSYYDVDHECLITSHSEEATINEWCQEISIAEIREYEKAHKKESFISKVIRKIKEKWWWL